MEIRELTTLSDEDLSAVLELRTAVAALDSPWVHPATARMLVVDLEQGGDGEPPRSFVGELEGRVVAFGGLELPERDNRHLAWVEVRVRPDVRRQGLGSELLQHLLRLARDAGRTSVGIDGWDLPAAVAFAERHGFVRASQAIQRRLYLQRTDPALVAKLVDEAAGLATGYELVRIKGGTPDHLLDAVVEITGAINDAPTDDLDVEDEVFSAERVRAYEQAVEAKGERMYRLLARHVDTGALAGQTVVAVEGERPTIAHQHDTSVVASHRGHRLGQLLKASMLEWLAEEERQVESIDTWNAESNDHMIGINENLGFVVLGRNLEYQQAL
jgi:GNAT superfamily N-acetyltransferase